MKSILFYCMNITLIITACHATMDLSTSQSTNPSVNVVSPLAPFQTKVGINRFHWNPYTRGSMFNSSSNTSSSTSFDTSATLSPFLYADYALAQVGPTLTLPLTTALITTTSTPTTLGAMAANAHQMAQQLVIPSNKLDDFLNDLKKTRNPLQTEDITSVIELIGFASFCHAIKSFLEQRGATELIVRKQAILYRYVADINFQKKEFSNYFYYTIGLSNALSSLRENDKAFNVLEKLFQPIASLTPALQGEIEKKRLFSAFLCMMRVQHHLGVAYKTRLDICFEKAKQYVVIKMLNPYQVNDLRRAGYGAQLGL